MLSIFSTLAPMFLILALGFVVGFAKVFRDSLVGINVFVFYLSLPAFVYVAIVSAPIPENVPLGMVFISGGVTTVLAIATYYTAKMLSKANPELAAPTSLSGTYGNVGYIGIPLTIAAVGPDAAIPAVLVHLVHNLVFMIGYPLLNPGRTAHATSDGERDGERDGKGKGNTGGVVAKIWPIVRRAVFLNPVALTLIIALLLVQFDIGLPAMVQDSVDLLGATAIPLSLFGVGLAMHSAIHGIRQGGIPTRLITLGVVAKLFALPLVTWAAVLPLSSHLGPVWGGALIMMAVMPSSTSSFVLSAQYDRNPGLAAAITAGSTILSLATIPLMVQLMLN